MARAVVVVSATLLALGAVPAGLAFVLRPDGALVGMPRAALGLALAAAGRALPS